MPNRFLDWRSVYGDRVPTLRCTLAQGPSYKETRPYSIMSSTASTNAIPSRDSRRDMGTLFPRAAQGVSSQRRSTRALPNTRTPRSSTLTCWAFGDSSRSCDMSYALDHFLDDLQAPRHGNDVFRCPALECGAGGLQPRCEFVAASECPGAVYEQPEKPHRESYHPFLLLLSTGGGHVRPPRASSRVIPGKMKRVVFDKPQSAEQGR